jgi:hypothetical protein
VSTNIVEKFLLHEPLRLEVVGMHCHETGGIGMSLQAAIRNAHKDTRIFFCVGPSTRLRILGAQDHCPCISAELHSHHVQCCVHIANTERCFHS